MPGQSTVTTGRSQLAKEQKELTRLKIDLFGTKLGSLSSKNHGFGFKRTMLGASMVYFQPTSSQNKPQKEAYFSRDTPIFLSLHYHSSLPCCVVHTSEISLFTADYIIIGSSQAR